MPPSRADTGQRQVGALEETESEMNWFCHSLVMETSKMVGSGVPSSVLSYAKSYHTPGIRKL